MLPLMYSIQASLEDALAGLHLVDDSNPPLPSLPIPEPIHCRVPSARAGQPHAPPFAPPPFTPRATQLPATHSFACTVEVPSTVSEHPGTYEIGVAASGRIAEFTTHPCMVCPIFPGTDDSAFEGGPKRKWYVVTRGFQVGIYREWSDCGTAVLGAPGAIHKAHELTYLEAKQLFCDAVVNGKASICPYVVTGI